MTGFERANLSFSVVKGQDREKFVKDYVKKNEGRSRDYLCSNSKSS